jgi:hypothetical protein
VCATRDTTITEAATPMRKHQLAMIVVEQRDGWAHARRH